MTILGRYFKAERVKWRKSWLLVTVILAPVCQVGFLGLIFWFSASRIRMFKPGFLFWLELNFVAWNLVIMPVLAALLCELSWEQEREARAWNRLLIQPSPRPTHYLVKVISHLSLALGSTLILAMALVLGGRLLQSNADLLMGALPQAKLVSLLAYSSLALMPVVAFQTWLSLRVTGFWGSLACGLAGSWISLKVVGATALVQFLPWGLAAHTAIIFERWRVLPWPYAFSSLVVAGILVSLGVIDFNRQSAPRS